MNRNTLLRSLLTAGLLTGVVATTPAFAETEEPSLHATPPASTSPSFAPVYSATAPTWGIIKRTEDLLGETRQESSKDSERFTLKGDVFFDVDKATLTSDAKKKLKEIGEELEGTEIQEVEVGGHTDSVDTDAHNDKLSEDRAKAVAKFLEDYFDNVDITATGHGKRQLAMAEEGTDEEIEEARSRNRRVEIDVKFLD